MTNQDFEGRGSSTSGEHADRNQTMRDAASEPFAKASDTAKDAGASDTAKDAGAKAKRAATDAAHTLSDHITGLLNDQLGAGAQSANRFAGSMRVAADHLQHESPMLAGLVRGLAHNVDGYADSLERQTIEQLIKNASDITRRQPAMMFGLAALAGFFAFRTFKSAGAGPVVSPPIQPTHDHPSGNING